MKVLNLLNPAHLFFEIGHDSLKGFNGTTALDLPLERLSDGRLTEPCKKNLAFQLKAFINQKSWQPRARAFCAIGARGVSLRRFSLPSGNGNDSHRLLPLQIERELPLSPDELAWGAQGLNGSKGGPGATNAQQEFLVAAVKKENLEEYASILSACGAAPVFTLAVLARSYLCPQPPGAYSVLALERTYSELITIEAGVPMAVRMLPWGREAILRHEQQSPPSALGEPRELLATPVSTASFGGSGPFATGRAAPSALASLVRFLKDQSLGNRLYLVGPPVSSTGFDLAAQLTTRLGNGVECHNVDLPAGTAGSTAILGLQQALERQTGELPLVLQVKQINGKARIARQAPLEWAAIAVGLVLLVLLFPYVEALTLKGHLARKLAAIQTDQGRLSTIDRELDFLEYLKESEPPYLDALLVLAKAAPPGTRFDSVSMNRRGELSIRGSLRDGLQVAELRSKMIDSGFFASVGIEEQSPSPDRQKFNIRMSAQWKPSGSRKLPPTESTRTTLEPKGAPAPTLAAPPDAAIPNPVATPSAKKANKN
jgi:hypothetical protein